MAVLPTTKTTHEGSFGYVMIPLNTNDSDLMLMINFRSPTHERLKPLTTNDFPSVQYSAPASSAFRISAHSTYGSIQLMDEAFHFGVGAATTLFWVAVML